MTGTDQTSPRLLGLGTALPPDRLTQADSLQFSLDRTEDADANSRRLAALYRRAGVQQRHLSVAHDFYPPGNEPGTAARMNAYAERAVALAAEASVAALAESGCEVPSITHLVTVSCTGFSAPGVDLGLVRHLDLSPDIARAHVGFMGCHGLLNGLGVARAFASQPNARVLVCAVELCSLHFGYGWDPDRLVAHSLFADGAAALVLGTPDTAPAPAPATSTSTSTGADWTLRATGSHLLPDSADAMTWRIGDHGFEMTLSSRVPELVGAQLRPWLEDWLARHDLDLASVGSWAVHPGGPRILTECARALELPAGALDVSRDVLARCGNMSSATVGFLLQRLRAERSPGPCVALAFGPGLVIEAALFDGRAERGGAASTR